MSRVAVIGDSHAEGLSVALPADLRAAGHSVALYEHHRGWSTRRLLDGGTFMRAARSGADIVIVSSGTNDPAMSDLVPMSDALHVLRAHRVIWFLPGPSRVDRVQRMIAAANARMLALSPGSLFNPRAGLAATDIATDGIHFTRSGYAKMARALTARVSGGGSSIAFLLIAAAALYFLMRTA